MRRPFSAFFFHILWAWDVADGVSLGYRGGHGHKNSLRFIVLTKRRQADIIDNRRALLRRLALYDHHSKSMLTARGHPGGQHAFAVSSAATSRTQKRIHSALNSFLFHISLTPFHGGAANRRYVTVPFRLHPFGIGLSIIPDALCFVRFCRFDSPWHFAGQTAETIFQYKALNAAVKSRSCSTAKLYSRP